ncbi:ABC transporter permease subunit [Xinfangfangia sp. CPCC 101601]|uniref:ABC transporter permease subunit n=1 Tax=Pseudogemmobacter lacusdianii TaxID=3069608 RepID=A0ABU0W1H9_9RHOB|nr:ABC transporter permease subunit [Xinfangfangia sp. CPCC 101601]MDQ2067748.1 ABC transporter permease subunit [Xinfangfangia sp. CPCC 101601]
MDFLNITDWSLLALNSPGWGGALLWGAVKTVQIALGGYIIGQIIGVCGAMGKVYGPPWLKELLAIYTTLIRAVPELILILILFYAGTAALNTLAAKIGMGPIDVNGALAGVLVISTVQGAYSTEVIRAAIQSIPSGCHEAAAAYGMSKWTTFKRVTLPLLVPRALPGMSNLWVIATKETALLSVVGFSELALVAKQAAGSTKYYMTFFLAACAIYLTITLISRVFFNQVEARFSRGMVKHK